MKIGGKLRKSFTKFLSLLVKRLSLLLDFMVAFATLTPVLVVGFFE